MNDNRRYPYPGTITRFYLDSLQELADQMGRTIEHQMFVTFLSGLERGKRRVAKAGMKSATVADLGGL